MADLARNLRRVETQFLESLLAHTQYAHLIPTLANAKVIEIQDEQPGCLRFVGSLMNPLAPNVIAERSFTDSDGVSVSASVSIDDAGRLLEFDVFKSNLTAVADLRLGLRKPSGPVLKLLAGMRS